MLRLARSGADKDGWALVSQLLLPLVKELPSELLDIKEQDGKHYCRLTEVGNNVLDWS